MNICVVSTACRVGGALSIYNQFLSHLEMARGDDKYYVFIDPCMPQNKIVGVEYFVMDTSGFKRTAFDICGFKKALNDMNLKADVIFSLQNTAVAYDKSVPQLVYYHQPLPFFKYHYNILKSIGRTYFFYHYFYPYYVRFYSHENVKYVVQTDYIKECFLKKFRRVVEGDVNVFFPDVEKIDKESIMDYEFETSTCNFFYPASGNEYKEHVTLVYSLAELRTLSPKMVTNIRIHLTLNEKDSPDLVSLVNKYNLKEQIIFHGSITHDRLLSMMKSSHGLLFPSAIETVGLPLLEAAALGIPVVANDLPFVHSVIDEYEGVSFVELHNYQLWSKVILSLSKERIRFPALKHKGSSWPEVFKLIKTLGGSKE